MPRKQRSPFETATARQKLAIRKKPFWLRLGPGLSLGYRRNQGAGTWSVRASDGAGGEWLKRFGIADDFEPADSKRIFNYSQAVDEARKLVRQGDGTEDPTKPLTLDQALTRYGHDLQARGANPYNAKQPRVHLTAALLSKPLALITAHELKHWRDSLITKSRSPATINRVMNSLQAALELVAKNRSHIWREGLESLPDSQRARNVVLPDGKVLELVAELYAHDAALGLLADVMAVTGARPGQAIRLFCEDLICDRHKPKLMMPKSGKGGGRNRIQKKIERYSVPITSALAVKLQRAAALRAPDEFLLLRTDGQPWNEKNPHADYRRDVRAVVAAIGLDPDEVTLYALRHSSIVRQLLRGVPIRLVAALHNTSVSQIERNYSRHISEHSDDVSRAALLTEPPPANVAVLARR